MPLSMLASFALSALMTVAACSRETPPESPRVEVAAPAAGSVGQALAGVTKITVSKGEVTRIVEDAAEIRAFLAAIGTEQTANDTRRRCPDGITLTFHAGAVDKGLVGLCNAELLGPEFAASGDRGGIRIADPAALRQLLAK